MATKQLPRVESWQHLAANYGAMRGYDDEYPMDVEAALKLMIAEYGEPTPHQKGQFRTFFYVGIANNAMNHTRGLMKYMNREQIAALAAEVEAMYAKHYEATFGQPTPAHDDEGGHDNRDCGGERG